MYTNSRNAANAYANIDRTTGAPPGAPPAVQAAQPQPQPQPVKHEASAYASSRNVAHSYANVSLETGVVAASPHKLIIMLYEGAELAVRMAIRYINEGDQAKKSAAITKASAIILEGLRSALDLKQGGDIAKHLDELYAYMNQRLMLAHVKNQVAPMEEVLGLLQELHGAWKQIGTPGTPGGPAPHSSHSIAA